VKNIQAPVRLLCQCQLKLYHLDCLDLQTFVEQRFEIVDQTELGNPPYDGTMLVPQRDVLQDW
jgi:hypothetical protein